MNEYIIKKGSQIKINGIPVIIKEDTKIESGSQLHTIPEIRKLLFPRKSPKK